MNILKYLFGGKNKSSGSTTEDELIAETSPPEVKVDEPTKADWLEAEQTLKASLKPCSLAHVGGIRPKNIDDAFKSWWGCFGLGRASEGIPICDRNGKEMSVAFQVLLDDLPHIPACLSDYKLLVLWADPALGGVDYPSWAEGENGQTFCVRTYKSLDGLKPLSKEFEEQKKTGSLFPPYPLRFEPFDFNRPSWEDFVERPVGNVARSVYQSFDSDWFFKDGNDLPQPYDFKIGGWPDWWQGTQWPKDKEFAFMMEHSEKGKFHLGGGVLNFFVGADGSWSFRGDFDY